MNFETYINNAPVIVREAYEIAKYAHRDDRRWDGSPYIKHIERVMLNTQEILNRDRLPWVKFEYDEFCMCLAALHDVVEDHTNEYTSESLQKELFKDKPSSFRVCLNILTRTRKQSYYLYIVGITSNLHCCRVKLADLIDNLFDLEPGNRRDKYLLAHHIIKDVLYPNILEEKHY